MLFKGFLTFFVVLFTVCLIILIFYLSYLPEARFDLNENKSLEEMDLECSFTAKEAIVFNGGQSQKYSPFSGGFLRLVTSAKIEENQWGEELVIKTKPFWMVVLISCFFIIFFASLVIREIFRRRI